MSPGPATLENEVTDPVEGTEKRTELASRLETITLLGGREVCTMTGDDPRKDEVAEENMICSASVDPAPGPGYTVRVSAALITSW